MAFSLANQTEGLSAEPPRNVVFILSDDHRADVLGAAGHPIIKTPNLDRLASEGVRFENAFVTTSICAASRATLLTGLYERGHRYTFRTVPMAKTITDLSYP
ncbi:MAG: sulfatase-like hydrolase/transferase, partial [Planctomycetota bacterium]|nr:sulfatase-like hydrolase/transferase [Planctomycetota bacterium]